MKTHVLKRLSAVFLSVAMALTFVPYSPAVEAAGTTYTLDTSSDLEAKAQGAFSDGQSISAGTSNYFTIYNSANTKYDSSKKSFSDNYNGTQRINFGGTINTQKPMNAIAFTTNAQAIVNVWWACGDVGRQICIVNSTGTTIYTSEDELAKNAPKLTSNIVLPSADTYYLGCTGGNNYFFKVEVIDGGEPPARGDWADVADPSITAAAVSADGKGIDVSVSAEVGNNGGDEVKVIMYDQSGKEVGTGSSAAKTSSHTVKLTPSASGDYTFKAVLSRADETDKESAVSSAVSFTLPLGKPEISSATNKGNGSMEIKWSSVKEATGYNVYQDGALVKSVTGTSCTVTGLTVGTEYQFTVSAVRDQEEGAKSPEFAATATAEEQIEWGFIAYGPSTDTKNNKVTGSLATDTSVKVESTGGKGKIQPTGADGIAFYYTPIPNSKNFTFRADLTVDSLTVTNAQEGFGIMAIDSLPEGSSSTDFYSNQYMAAVSKVEYRYDSAINDVTEDPNAGVKYTMKVGVGINAKLDITPEKLAQGGTAITEGMKQYTLETTAVDLGLPAGTYNIIENTNSSATEPAGELLNKVTLEIQRNNTGYFITYYDQTGNVVRKQKFYDTGALSVLDPDNVYVGFFAARNAAITVSNVQLTTIDPADDAPAEEKPVEIVTPSFAIKSAAVANNENYTLSFTSNVAGTVEIYMNGMKIMSGIEIAAEETVDRVLTLNSGKNSINVKFTPDPDQKMEGKVLANTDVIEKNITVNYDTYFSMQSNLYVAPNGTSKGNGGPSAPLDIYTAVSVAQPGQTIVVMEGTYNLSSPVRIERGIDGTAEKPIRMIADPEAESRPVFDFGKISAGFNCGGNYWYFKGFDVTNTANGQGGFYLCGSNCTADQLNTYHNGNTGLQVRAFNNSNDPRSLWPHDVLILNCTSYGNADVGYEDADGFAAKLTVGENIVFDGCIAHHNADDGWDLFAKPETGSIGAVTIKNCVAYANGILEDGTDAGNGNGFKLGGSNLPGGHKLINSIAFDNKANGITCNSCPDISVENCTTYNNGGKNLTLYTNADVSTDFSVKGLISYKGGKDDDVKPKGSQDATKYNGNTNYYCIGGSSKHFDGSGDPLSDDMFTSLTPNLPIKRTESGTIDLEGFLELNEKAPAGSGASTDKITEGKPSEDTVITPDAVLPGGRVDIKPVNNGENSGNESSSPAVTVKDDESGISVTGSIPENTVLKVEKQPAAEDETSVVYDITLEDQNGNKVQPNGSVEVKLPIPEKFKGKTCYVYREEADGSYTDMKAKEQDGVLVFTTDHFSRYIISIKALAASGDSTGDKNAATGVGITFVPAALAAAGVVLFKKKR